MRSRHLVPRLACALLCAWPAGAQEQRGSIEGLGSCRSGRDRGGAQRHPRRRMANRWAGRPILDPRFLMSSGFEDPRTVRLGEAVGLFVRCIGSYIRSHGRRSSTSASISRVTLLPAMHRYRPGMAFRLHHRQKTISRLTA